MCCTNFQKFLTTVVSCSLNLTIDIEKDNIPAFYITASTQTFWSITQ